VVNLLSLANDTVSYNPVFGRGLVDESPPLFIP